MQLGDWQLDTVQGGHLRLDGGTMFGAVPRDVWAKVSPPDEHNRIRMATNCVLARDGRHTVLFDSGYGEHPSPRRREQQALEAGQPLLESLARLDVGPEAIDCVVFSHLHFDHSGGATCRDAQGTLRPTFPNARYVMQHREWRDALSTADELRGSYQAEELRPWLEQGRLELVKGAGSIVPGIYYQRSGGHTPGHQVIIIESGKEAAVYAGDICPTRAHLRTLWCMGYDLGQLQVRRLKPQMLAKCAAENMWLLLDHDPDVAACRIAVDPKTEFVVTETREVL